ncbi:ABC transporter ATP-binding protein [uncultured Desulfovibrio sp.]|uniref:ABC transporter ATP-binding protein n=1 Tax=uncultured Desulfovibrio sp. TaxID=167968 RepID=UPI002638404E|nr:ABC transporter ATP-binding protein [uncultured Desulfovibrio sp.]
MIEFEHVTYTYPFQERPAVEDISLRVRPGEIVLCTGASGCGKSTLIRLSNGLCPHYYRGCFSGDVRIGGISTREQRLAEISRRLGTLFQDPEQQFFTLGVEEELVFALEWQGWSAEAMRAAVRRAVDEFGLAPLLGASLHTLSEGEKQKVGLAAIRMQEPGALILDEPTANLDPEATVDLARKLRQLADAGMAILVVDHRLYWLRGIADRILVMKDGRIHEQGAFSLLEDAALRERYGLRAADVRDVRHVLPACAGGAAAMVRVENLCFAHPGRKPLYENASFGLPAGVTALLGRNGAGKTTLARILAGLDAENGGRLVLDGRPCGREARLKRCGIVLQNADHQLHMRTVRQELETCLLLAGSREASRVGELLRDFALEDLAERHPQSLSGGQKQRLVIACALAKDPRVLILDEPTSGLDGANMRRLAAVLAAQAAQGRCALLITHDLELLGNGAMHALRLPLKTTENI